MNHFLSVVFVWLTSLLGYHRIIGTDSISSHESYPKMSFQFSIDQVNKIFYLMEFHDEVQVLAYEIRDGDSVYKVIEPLCPKLESTLTITFCPDFIDEINNLL